MMMKTVNVVCLFLFTFGTGNDENFSSSLTSPAPILWIARYFSGGRLCQQQQRGAPRRAARDAFPRSFEFSPELHQSNGAMLHGYLAFPTPERQARHEYIKIPRVEWCIHVPELAASGQVLLQHHTVSSDYSSKLVVGHHNIK